MMFETDVFISYSHKDDEPLLDEKGGWVSDLHQALEVRVEQLLGKKPKIWRDPRQSGNEYFTDGFLEQIRKTAVMVSVLSPSYLSSQYCPAELDAFFEACRTPPGLRVGNHARIFKVVKTQLPEQVPVRPELKEFLGYEFFAVDSMTDRVREFWRAFGDEAKMKFVQKAEDLAQDISRLLRQLKGLEPQAHPEVRQRRGFVYLAVTSSDLKEEREALRRDLDRSGYTVLPDRPLPETSPEVEAMVREEVARCQLSVHMIGRKYGLVPEGTALSIPELQNELAAEHSRKAELNRLVWLAPAQAVEDDRQKAFIGRLQTAPELQGRMDLLEGSVEDLKNAVHRCLEPRPSPAGPAPSPGSPREGGAPPPRVYLICDQQDQEQSQETLQRLQDLLFNADCEPILPLFDGDEADIRQDHEDNLRTCDAALLYWGAGSEAWRRKKLNEVLYKSAGLGRTKGTPLTLLYVAPPATREKEALRTREALVVRQPPEGPTEAVLAACLEQLQRHEPKGSDEPS
jgi:hypothetical protein